MSEDQRLKGRRRAYFRSRELLVALEHVDLVTSALETASVSISEVERSEALGLARVVLDTPQQAAQQVLMLIREDGRDDSQRRDTTAMDALVVGLRQHFRRRYAGWVPTIGKNRILGRVVGGGVISHGGGPAPTASLHALPERSGTAGSGVRVGVLDTRIYPHPWLAGGWAGPADTVLETDGVRAAVTGHATFITGLVLSQAPGAVVEMRHVLSDETGEADSWEVAKAIVELGRSGIDVLNLSLVCYTEDGQAPLALAAAVERLDPAIVVVAAAGNHGDPAAKGIEDADDHRKPTWPAALDHVVAVGAATREGRRTSFTPEDAAWIDVLAPGESVVSTFLEGRVQLDDEGGAETFSGFAEWSGTSFAAALVSGAIAAHTKPGEVSARQAWKQLIAPLGPRQDPDTPAFLPLTLPASGPADRA